MTTRVQLTRRAPIDYPTHMDPTYTITCCPAPQRADALRSLHAGLPADQQTALVHALDAVRQQDESVFDGLLVATESDVLVGAVWAQLSAGRTAAIWLPDVRSPAALDLMRAIALFLDQQQVTLAQFLVTDDSDVDPEVLAAGDFKKLVRLAYLTVDVDSSLTVEPLTVETSSPLTFQPNANAQPDRLGKLLFRTYEGSQDCPQLNGVRSADEVLAGYRQQGTFADERWFFVQSEDREVGALILTEHADTKNWELVYMGLVPEARGNGWGRAILDFARLQAGHGGAERLVLAVDEANSHAMTMYQRAGMKVWDRRTVYARLRPTNASS